VYNLYNSVIGRWFHNCVMRNRHERRLRAGLSLHHSWVDKEIFDFYSLKVKVVPLGRTNYSYFVQDTATGLLAVVDPGDHDYLVSIANDFFHCQISAVLLTHKHWDHSAGIHQLRRTYPSLRTYASKEEKIPDITDRVADGEVISLGNTKVKVISTPVHTSGSVIFFIQTENAPGVVFTGDTLFVGGMGAFFEGDIKKACSSISKIINLPDDTLMFPGHEYAETTLKFALYLQPQNKNLLRKVSWVVKRRARYMMTIPTSIRDEKNYNPFLRIYDPNFYPVLGVAHYLAAIAKLQELRMRKRHEYKNIELTI
jgi:hydroxyacylglutathione hydrolase